MALLKRAEHSVEAFAISRNLAAFEDLDKELESEFDDGWRSFNLFEGREAFDMKLPDSVQFVVVAVNAQDEEDLDSVIGVIRRAKEARRSVLLIAQDISPAGMHRLMRSGADDFAPYPLPAGLLSETVTRLRENVGREPEKTETRRRRKGYILPVYSVAGGAGATTFAVNLAYEMAEHVRKTGLRVALLDFNFQYGSVATYLDLPRREAIYELISDPATLDHDGLAQALTSYKKRLAVLTAPSDALPLDIIAPEDVGKLLEIAVTAYDFVIVDMPQTLVVWSDLVLQMCETFFAVLEVDMRSAQNMLRFLRALKAEDLPYEKVQYVLNRAPGFTDLTGKSRVKRLCDSLGIDINIFLPDGGKAVVNACDQGTPLADAASGNALRKEIRKVAISLVEMAEAQAAAIA
ncbi:MAG: pilus assembly protein CpaE [Alphaproteobacteria bacterium]|nr:MAG: pilus assembly protein CpaE [Alphaproteobacteria bacterium]